MKNFAYSLMAKSFAISSAFFVAFSDASIKKVEAACPPGQYVPDGKNCSSVSGGAEVSYSTVKNNLAGEFSDLYGVAAAILLSIAVLVIIYAGFLYMTSTGNPDKLTKAKKLLISSGLGIITIASSYTIYKFLTTLAVASGWLSN